MPQNYKMEQKFSRIIQGCMTWGQWGKKLNREGQASRMHTCLEAGITTFDHADIYGDYSTEEEFGHAFAKADIPRDNIQLISKCGIQYMGKGRPENRVKHYQYDAEYIVRSAERSLKLLQTDYLDLFLMHRPSPLMQPEEMAQAAEKLKVSGKIKAFGVSNFTPSQTDLIAQAIPIAANQIEFSLTAFGAMYNGSLDHMMINEILPMAWSPLGNVFKENDDRSSRLRKAMESLCEKYNATKDQLALAWILKHPSGIHPVIGTTTPERIKGAVDALEIDLELQDWFELLVASQGHKVP